MTRIYVLLHRLVEAANLLLVLNELKFVPFPSFRESHSCFKLLRGLVSIFLLPFSVIVTQKNSVRERGTVSELPLLRKQHPGVP